MKRFHSLLASLALLATPACGGDDDGNSDDGDGSSADGGDTGDVDSGPDQDGFVPILTVDWTLPPPDGPTPDEYWCATHTLSEDLVITAFRDMSPSGTHHTVISAGASGGADNPGFPCDFANNHNTLLFASGVGTDDFEFPDGVGIRVPAGQQLLLNVHLFNASDDELSGTSGVSAITVPSVETEAEFTFAGDFLINIPQGETGHTETGVCPIEQDATILNWWPHMHQLGRHMTVEINDETVHDEVFNFMEQVNYPTERQVSAGDQIRVTCTYDGHPDHDTGFGDSSNQEMCFAGFYRYPKADQPFCPDGFGF